MIGAGALVEHAYIGPYTSIGDRRRGALAEMENSIVLEDSRDGGHRRSASRPA